MRQRYEIVKVDLDNDDELAFVIHNGCLMQFDDDGNLMYAVIRRNGRISQEEVDSSREGEFTDFFSICTTWEDVESLEEESIQALEKAFPKEKKAFAHFRKMNAPYTGESWFK